MSSYLLHEIRRYPVKAMGGESLESVAVDARGLAGDRAYAVVDADGKLATGKHSQRFRHRSIRSTGVSRTSPTSTTPAQVSSTNG